MRTALAVMRTCVLSRSRTSVAAMAKPALTAPGPQSFLSRKRRTPPPGAHRNDPGRTGGLHINSIVILSLPRDLSSPHGDNLYPMRDNRADFCRFPARIGPPARERTGSGEDYSNAESPARPLAATKRNGLPQRRRDTEVEKKQVISFFLCELCDLCVEESSPHAKKLTVSSAEKEKRAGMAEIGDDNDSAKAYKTDS